MSPRIRTLKPENWHNEQIGRLSRDARLLRDVLITYADDDGRWRHLPVAVIGHGYPYDDDVTPARLARWMKELVEREIVFLYERDGCTYGCFPTWHVHQQINKYQASRLPSCSDPRVVTREEAARIKRGASPEDSGSTTGGLPESDGTSTGVSREDSDPHAQARGSLILDPVPDPSSASENGTAPSREREADRPEVVALCRHLADGIIANDPKAQPKWETKGWRAAARLLIDADQREPAEAHAVIDFCQTDDFWRGVILSMPKFREKYPQLLLKMNRAPAAAVNGHDPWIAQMEALKTPEAS